MNNELELEKVYTTIQYKQWELTFEAIKSDILPDFLSESSEKKRLRRRAHKLRKNNSYNFRKHFS